MQLVLDLLQVFCGLNGFPLLPLHLELIYFCGLYQVFT